MRLILYSKPDCHLCEGLQEKLEQITTLDFDLEIRDITTRDDWFQTYEYEVPVLVLDRENQTVAVENRDNSSQPSSQSQSLIPIPRPSPRASVRQLEQMLQKYLVQNSENRAE
ncbi:MAG: glutaredoxin family protein [Elainellaceae cyanobacterium]